VLVNSLYSPNSIYAVTNATFALVEMQTTFPRRTHLLHAEWFGSDSNSVAYSGPVTFGLRCEPARHRLQLQLHRLRRG